MISSELDDDKRMVMHYPERVHPLIVLLITEKYATYKELKETYDIFEFLDLLEIAMTEQYNKSVDLRIK